ncbi:MAG TPA: ABC transporter permease [Gemmatirosa sp.]|nr:ABC transporter permease [Gemmatirosa sp.]
MATTLPVAVPQPHASPSPGGSPRALTRLEFEIAWRYLRSRRGSRLLSLISVIAIGGVLVGVSALILIMGVMNGLQRDLREKILVGSPDVRVLTYGDDLRMESWRATLQKVRKVPGVEAVAPMVMAYGLIGKGSVQNYTTGAQIMGIEPQGPGVAEVTTIRAHAVMGDFRFATADGQLRGAVLGKRLAEQLNAWPGDKLTIVTRAGVQLHPVTGTPIPTYEEFQVTGIVETGMYEYDNSYVFVALSQAQRLAGLASAVTGLDVRTSDRWRAERVAVAVSESLGFPFFTRDWQEQNRSLFQALKLEKLGMSVILLLIVLVAAFNIVSTLTMVVTDKTREIGILKAMGLPARSVRRIFFLQGLVIGLVGTLGGTLLGLVASIALGHYKLIRLDPSVYFIDHLPVALEPLEILATLLASVAIAAVATLYPAQQAAKLYPLEAIRHE